MSVRRILSVVGGLTLLCGGGGALAQPAPPPTPQIFAPGVISGPSNDGAPTFSPDGRTLLFERSYANSTAIFEAHRTGAGWSRPQVAAFSGPSSDQQPSFSPDGRYVVYASSRLRPSTTQPGGPPEVYTHLWRVERRGQGWSEPERLPDTVNISRRMFKP
ncbi:MAG TPA: hypothetical protein VFH92_09955, partial [Phenylobacterium sp.]|nr:hypothetical protein [Phenylobacterium sp.]